MNPLLANMQVKPKAEANVSVKESCNCCVPWLSRRVRVMDLPTTEPMQRKGNHTVYTMTRITTENIRESN